MKALTLWQPWATLVALGVKTIETRSWSTSYRGPLAIHAAKKAPEYGPVGAYLVEPWFDHVRHVEDCYCDGAEIDEPCSRRARKGWALTRNGEDAIVLPLGAVVATCTLVDVVPISSCRGDMDRATKRLLWTAHVDGHLSLENYRSGRCSNVEDQRPYGNFAHGRFAWMLDNITARPEPVAAKGGQRIWNWRAGATP